MDLAAGTGDTRISRAPAGEVAALPRGLRRWQVRGSHGAAGGGGHGARGAAPSAARPRLSTAARRGKLGASRSRAVTTLREASTVRLAHLQSNTHRHLQTPLKHSCPFEPHACARPDFLPGPPCSRCRSSPEAFWQRQVVRTPQNRENLKPRVFFFLFENTIIFYQKCVTWADM